MKKIFFAMAALTAMTFTACGNKTAQGDDNDSIPADSVVLEEEGVAEATEAATTAITALADQLKVEDTASLTYKIEEIKTYVQNLIQNGKLEAAKVYVEKVQNFISDNEEKLSALNIDGTPVKDLLSKVTALADAPELLNNAADAAVSAGKEAVEGAVEDAKTKANDAVEAAKAKAQEKVDAAKAEASAKANEAVESAKSKAYEAGKKAGEDAKKALNDAANEAKKNLGL